MAVGHPVQNKIKYKLLKGVVGYGPYGLMEFSAHDHRYMKSLLKNTCLR